MPVKSDQEQAQAGIMGQGTTQPVTTEMLMKIFGLSAEQAEAISLIIPGLVKAEMQASGGVMPGMGATLNSVDQAQRAAAQPPAAMPGMENIPPEIQMLAEFFWEEIAPRLMSLGIDPMEFPQIPPANMGQPGMGMGPGAPPGPGMMRGTPMQGQNRGTPLQGTGIPPNVPLGGMPTGGAMPAQAGASQGQRLPWLNETDEGKLVGIFQDESGHKIMLDSIEMDIQEDSIRVDGGILTGDAVMTAAMVQTYKKDGKERRVLKDPEELKRACDVYPVPMPITRRHPKEGIVMSQDEIKGWTTPPIWDEEKKHVTTQIRITDADLIKDITVDKKTDVSIGFFCDLDETAGKFNDEDYEAVQRNLVYNHLAAGLDRGHGRCPDGTCGIKTEDEQEIDWGEIDWKEFEGKPCVGDSHYDWLMQNEKDAKLSAEQRRALPDSAFCGPGRSFPVNDCAHYTAAKRMLSRYEGPGNRDTILACIERKGKALNCPGAKDSKKNNSPKDKEQNSMTNEKPKTDKKNEPETKAQNGQADPAAGEPQKDEATTYVDEMIAAERKKLVDSIMDTKPPRDRPFYEGKPLADLRDLAEFLGNVRPGQFLPAGKGKAGDSKAEIDAAYDEMEKKLQGR